MNDASAGTVSDRVDAKLDDIQSEPSRHPAGGQSSEFGTVKPMPMNGTPCTPLSAKFDVPPMLGLPLEDSVAAPQPVASEPKLPVPVPVATVRSKLPVPE